MVKKKKNAAKKTAVARGIDREIKKENGTLIISRGIHAIHTSRAEKRRNKRVKKEEAIKDSEDQ